MSYGIRIIEKAGTLTIGPGPRPGAWVRTYDPEGHDGQGDATWTMDPNEALAFPTPQAAFRTWRAIPECKPLRPDGLPNRPLTAYTVEILSLTPPIPEPLA